MRNILVVALLAAGLAGCAATAEQEKKDAAFGAAFDADWRGKNFSSTPPVVAPVGNPQDPAAEDREFQDWRAWQEWKRRNPK